MLIAATSECIPWLAVTSLQSRLRDLWTLTEAASVTQATPTLGLSRDRSDLSKAQI